MANHKEAVGRHGRYLSKYLLVLCSGGFFTACTPPPVDSPEANVDDVGLDPQTVFEQKVKPELNAVCQSCHQVQQLSYEPFLLPGDEYRSITTYAMGRFLTAQPAQSTLLTKGAHTGPALTSDQESKVRGWLELEAAARGMPGQSTPTTPSMPVRLGDYNMNLKALVMDPLARLSFSLVQRGTTYELNKLTLHAGPTAGVQIQAPRLIILSSAGARPEPNDAFSTIDQTVLANQQALIGSGTLLLSTNLSTAARIAFIFAQIKTVMPTGVVPTCKNLAEFDSTVRPKLAACAEGCHGASATDPQRSGQARLAFDMALINSTTPADKDAFCLDVLARALPVTNTASSILIRQATPYDESRPTDPLNGTQNHPFYKIMDATVLDQFRTSVQAWAPGAQ